MSFIDFPDVPVAPGVPDVRRTVIGVGAISGVIGALESIDRFGILSGVLAPQWGVFEKSGAVAVTPDTVVRFNYRGEEKIASHPVEDGGFASYNKVALPYDIQMVIACNGQEPMSRDALLGQLDQMKASTDLYDIVTPDFAYLDVNLVSYDYRRQSSNGVSLIQVDLRFEEVRVTALSTFPATQEPSGAPPISNGGVKAKAPSKSEQAAFEGIF